MNRMPDSITDGRQADDRDTAIPFDEEQDKADRKDLINEAEDNARIQRESWAANTSWWVS